MPQYIKPKYEQLLGAVTEELARQPGQTANDLARSLVERRIPICSDVPHVLWLMRKRGIARSEKTVASSFSGKGNFKMNRWFLISNVG